MSLRLRVIKAIGRAGRAPAGDKSARRNARLLNRIRKEGR